MFVIKKKWLVFLIIAVLFSVIGIAGSMLSGCGGNQLELVEGKPVLFFADGVETPSVSLGSNFATQNSQPTTIADFKDGYNKKVITVLFRDDNTTIVSNEEISLAGDLSFDALTGDSITLVKLNDVWEETYRKLR